MAVTQIHFRFGVNSGTEADHGWHAAEDTNPTAGDGQTIPFATTFLLRCGVVATSTTNNYVFTWAYAINGGSMVNITTTSAAVKAVDGILSNGSDCTQRLTAGGGGTFLGTGNAGQTEDGTGGGTSCDIGASGNFTESEIALQLVAAGLANGDVVTFQCGTATLTATPTLTIVKAATPKTATPPAEALGSGSDSTSPTIDRRGLLRPAPDADPWGTLADTAPTIDLAVATAPKTAVPDADPLGSYADVHEVTLGRAKGWDDSLAYLETAALVAQPDADPLGSYADADPTIDERGFLLANIPAEAWGTLDDAAPSIDLQEVPATPLTADCPEDAWATLADTDPTILEMGALAADCPADPWANLADADPTILETGALVAAPDADAWGDLADTTPTVDRQELGSTPLTADCPADAWGTLEDAAPTIVMTGALVAEPAEDPLGSYADGAPTIDERGALAVEVPADAWETVADTAPTVDRQVVGITPLTADLPADAFPSYVDVGDPHLGRARGWEDALAYEETGALTFASAEDPLGGYADAAPTIDRQELGTTPLTADCPADSLGTYADAAPTVDERGSLTVAVPADGWETLADTAPTVDRQELGSDLTAQITDAKEAFADSVAVEGIITPLTATPTDAFAAYGDSALPWLLEAEILYADGVTYTYGKDYPFEADPWGTLADALAVETVQSPDLQVQVTDSMAISDTIVALFAQAVTLPTDTWETLADAVAAGSPKAIAVTDANEAYTDTWTHERGLLYRATDDQNAYAETAAALLGLDISPSADGLEPAADALAAWLAYQAVLAADALGSGADALAILTRLITGLIHLTNTSWREPTIGTQTLTPPTVDAETWAQPSVTSEDLDT